MPTTSRAFQGQLAKSKTPTTHTINTDLREAFAMLKRALVALLLPFLSLTPSYGAGTIAYSLSQQLDQYGVPLSGCLLYTIQAGTTSTPQNAYKDVSLTLPHTNPIVCDASGRLPQFFLADGQIKIRLTSAAGVQQVVADNILVIGASSGSGGGGSVDPTTVAATGDLKWAYGTGTISGWVRLNGRTIGSATSGASEWAFSTAQALFLYLCGIDSSKVIGHSGTCQNDWDNNRQLTLPDARGRTLAGLDDMGNSAAGRFGSATFGAGNGVTLGATIGNPQKTIATANLPPYTPGGSITMSGSVSPSVVQGRSSQSQASTGCCIFVPDAPSTLTINGNSFSATWNGTAQGGASMPFDLYQPSILSTVYIKL